MSKLEELIQQYCPDGVRFVTLDSIAVLSRGKVISKDYIKENEGDYPVYSSQSANDGVMGRIDSYMYNGDYLTWTTDGAYAGTVFRRSGKFNITNVCGLVEVSSQDIKLDFLYYWLYSEAPKYVNSGMGNPKLMSNVMGTISVPIPPLLVQEEIVRILDTFTELQAELQAELQKRLQQYNYYRDNLLSFEGRTDVEWKKLGDVCDFRNGFAFKSDLFKAEGFPIVRITNITGQGIDMQDVKFFHMEDYPKAKMSPFEIEDGDILVAMSGATTGKIGVYKGRTTAYLNQRTGKFVPHKGLNNRFLYHFLLTQVSEMYRMAGGGAQPNLSSNDLKTKISIPIPSLPVQEKIADILDRFDSLTNDLTAGLPAEIEKRKQQYEYYRDKLLTFKRLNA